MRWETVWYGEADCIASGVCEAIAVTRTTGQEKPAREGLEQYPCKQTKGTATEERWWQEARAS